MKFSEFLKCVRVGWNDDCWIWLGSKRNGYGTIWFDGKSRLAHRVAYGLFFGVSPGRLYVCHKCGNAACVNPYHLYAGTQAQNMVDMELHGRRIRGSKCPAAKLTEDDVREIRKLHAEGVTQQVLANRFGVHNSTVNAVVNRKQWSHVP